jgi:membrane protease YdiL (CAAX protease family)
METHVLAAHERKSFPRIASLWHTALVLAVAGLFAYRGMIRVEQARGLVNPNRMAMYGRTILFEWLMLGLVLLGVWLHGSSVFTVVGDKWRSIKEVLRDFGIGVTFMMASVAVLSSAGSLMGAGGEKASQFILPQGRVELAVWVMLSISAGICEEAVYRGYFQRQFIALTNSVPAGIILCAAAFGAAHSYFGRSQAFQISLLGMMSGVLAYWRRSVRPGMLAYTLQDVLGAIFRH